MRPFERRIVYGKLMAKGLLLCSLGDFLLRMEDHPQYGGEGWLAGGLVSFLVGHLCFGQAFSGRTTALKVAGFD